MASPIVVAAAASAATSSGKRRPRSLSRIHFGKDGTAAAAHRLSLALDARTMAPPRDALPVPAVPPAPTHRGCAKRVFAFDERSTRGARKSTSRPNTPRSQRQNVAARDALGNIENLQVVLLDISVNSSKPSSHDDMPPRFPRSLTLPTNVAEFRNVHPHDIANAQRPRHLQRPQSSKFVGDSSRMDLSTPSSSSSRQRPHSANVDSRTFSHRDASSENLPTENTSSHNSSNFSKPHVPQSSHSSRHQPPLTTRASRQAPDFDFGRPSSNTHMQNLPTSRASRRPPNFDFDSLSTSTNIDDHSTSDTNAMQISLESERSDVDNGGGAASAQSVRPSPARRFVSVPVTLSLDEQESSQSFRHRPPPSTLTSKRPSPGAAGFGFGSAMTLVTESDRTAAGASSGPSYPSKSSRLQLGDPSAPSLKLQQATDNTQDASGGSMTVTMLDSTPAATPYSHMPPAPTHRGAKKRGMFAFPSQQPPGEGEGQPSSSGIVSLGAITAADEEEEHTFDIEPIPVVFSESEIPEVQMEMDMSPTAANGGDTEESSMCLAPLPTSSASRRFGGSRSTHTPPSRSSSMDDGDGGSGEAAKKKSKGGGGGPRRRPRFFPSLSISIAEDDGKGAEKPFVPLNNSDNLLHEVVPRVFISSVRGARNQDEVTRCGITDVINCTMNLPQDHPNLNFLRVPVRDRWGADLLSHVDKANEFITAALQRQDGRVLVHCRAGISRSTAIIMAYLIHSRHLTVDEAFETVKLARNCAQPNVDFVGQLNTFKEACASRMAGSSGSE